MAHRKMDLLRPLTDDEVAALAKLHGSRSKAASRVTPAALILAVARGCDYRQAVESIGPRSGDAVSHRVARFDAEGTAAIDPRHGGVRAPLHDPLARERILQEARRRPTPEADGTASWSSTTLRKALRSAPDGLGTPEEIIGWFEAVAGHWNRLPTPFEWGGKRRGRRQRQRERRRLGGSGALV